MSAEDRAAATNGRRAVRLYLEALQANRPRRGRKRTPESVQKRLDAIEIEIEGASPLKRLQLVQERMDLDAELIGMANKPDLAPLQKGFTDNAKAYGESKGITYAAWRELGVDSSTLKAAGITRGG
jgi:hypothetical protein